MQTQGNKARYIILVPPRVAVVLCSNARMQSRLGLQKIYLSQSSATMQGYCIDVGASHEWKACVVS